MATKGSTNWRAMQVPARKEPSGMSWPAPIDTNTRAMTMGSWRTRRTGKIVVVAKGAKK